MLSKLLYLLVFFPVFSFAQTHFWTGGVTAGQAIVEVCSDPEPVSIICVSENNDTCQAISVTDHASGKCRKFSMEELQANTKYNYVLYSGSDEAGRGSFQTFPEKPADFKFVVGSCLRNTNHPVFTRMEEEEPLFYINSGDIHYADIKDPVIDPRIDAFRERVLDPPEGKSFFSKVPLAYMWDDHDYCGNNSGSDCKGRNAALEAYRAAVPHYPVNSKTGAGIYQAFSVANVRFILTDLRSERTERYLMSAEQEEWFRQQILNAAEAKQMICWVSSIPWIGTAHDTWGDYRLERRRISEFIRDNNITNLFMIAGDAHMLGADNGQNSDYSSERIKNGFPVLHAAALNQVGTTKGGPYSEGAFPNPDGTGQYGLVEIKDLGDGEMCVSFTGKRVFNDGTVSTVMKYDFCKIYSDPLQFRLFPNPAQNAFSLEIMNAPFGSQTRIQVIDMSGKRVISEDLHIAEGRNLYHFSPGNSMTSGIYLVRFWYLGTWYARKLSYQS